jgi:hypothetical protein
LAAANGQIEGSGNIAKELRWAVKNTGPQRNNRVPLKTIAGADPSLLLCTAKFVSSLGGSSVTAIKAVEPKPRAIQVPVLALFVCAVGIAGLVHDSWPSAVPWSWINLHVIFGVLLWIMGLDPDDLEAVRKEQMNSPRARFATFADERA